MSSDIASANTQIDTLLPSLREALAACVHPRLFKTERGFQGQLLIELHKRLNLSDQTIIEQEYQKSLSAHGLNIRPDIIIHQPYDPSHHQNRMEGNIAVIELKLNATPAKASADLANLASMLNVLNYPIGIFINIGSPENYVSLVPENIRGRIITFAVTLNDGRANVFEAQT